VQQTAGVSLSISQPYRLTSTYSIKAVDTTA